MASNHKNHCMRNVIIFFALLFSISTSFAQNSKSCKTCEELIHLQFPDVTILFTEHKLSDTIKQSFEDWTPTFIINKPFCRILGRISEEINFELLMPDEGNGRFLMSGGGGFVGSIQNCCAFFYLDFCIIYIYRNHI